MVIQSGVLADLKSTVADAYGGRLQGLVVYGSEARGEADADSDVDLLVLLTGPIDYWQEVKRLVDIVYPLVLQYERPVHAKPVDAALYETQIYPLHRRARQEGLLV